MSPTQTLCSLPGLSLITNLLRKVQLDSENILAESLVENVSSLHLNKQ